MNGGCSTDQTSYLFHGPVKLYSTKEDNDTIKYYDVINYFIATICTTFTALFKYTCTGFLLSVLKIYRISIRVTFIIIK